MTDCLPHRMADGRTFTDYTPRCYSALTCSSFAHRQHLIHHGESIVRKSSQDVYAQNVLCSRPCVQPGTMLPEQSKQVCNEGTCQMTVTDPQGLGLGRADSRLLIPEDEYKKQMLENQRTENCRPWMAV